MIQSLARITSRLKGGDGGGYVVAKGTPAAVEAHPTSATGAALRAYTEALRVIFPGRRVSAALLYTAGPHLFELPS